MGLAIFCGFIMYDTQLIIIKVQSLYEWPEYNFQSLRHLYLQARHGDRDFIAHSLDLFIDFIQVFRKILVLLMQKEDEGQKKKR